MSVRVSVGAYVCACVCGCLRVCVCLWVPTCVRVSVGAYVCACVLWMAATPHMRISARRHLTSSDDLQR